MHERVFLFEQCFATCKENHGVLSRSSLEKTRKLYMSRKLYFKRTGHTTLLRRWINVIDVDSTSQQRHVGSEAAPPLYFELQTEE